MVTVQTLLLLLALATVMGAVVSIAVHYRRFQVRGTALGSWGFSLLASGFLLLGLRHYMPLAVAVLLPNALGMTGFMLICLGLNKFVSEQGAPKWRIGVWIGVILASLVVKVIYLDDPEHVNLRIATTFFVLAYLAVDTAVVLFRKGETRKAVMVLGLFYAVFSMTCVALAAYHCCWPEAGYFFQANSVSWFLFLGMAFAFIMIIGHIFMVSEELHARLERRNKVLEENLRLRDDVESITRHDLKTPIASVAQAIEYLISSSDLDAEARELLIKARRSAMDALDMINLSLDVYKLENGTYALRCQNVDLADVLRRASEDVLAPLGGRKLAVDLTLDGRPLAPEDAFPVKGEFTLLYAMVANLLKNAVEASPQGGRVLASLGRDGDLVRLAIENEGLLDPEMRGRMFEKFTTSGKYGGTGLGAYSARLAAEAHGGNVALDESVPGKVRVVATLPVGVV